MNETFEGCTSLTQVTLTDGLTAIGYATFKDCENLPGITLPQTLTDLGLGSFINCTGLTEIYLPASLTFIEMCDIFTGCSNLTLISVDPANEAYATYDGALYDKSLETLYICPPGKTGISLPASLTSIAAGAFSSCAGLTGVTLPDCLTQIDYNTFYGCASLAYIDIPASVTRIGSYAFYGCASLTSVTITAVVESVEGYAFCGCGSLTDVFIYAKYTYFDEYESAFDAGVTIHCYPNSSAEQMAWQNGYTVSLMIDETMRTLTLPAGLTQIDEYAFAYLENVDVVRIPATVQSIAETAFEGSRVLIIAPSDSYAYDWALGMCFYVIAAETLQVTD